MKYDICVFGGCSLDLMYYQKPDGSYDDKPNMSVPGGKGANQAVAASRAGAKTTIITRIGKDEIGKAILENLRFNMIDTANVEMLDGISNDHSNIYINIKDKDNKIERISGAINSFTPDMIENYAKVLLTSKIIISQLKVPKEVTEKLINFCYKHNKTLILTPCRPEKLSITEQNNKQLIDKISIITANRKECETMFHTKDIESCVQKYPNKLIVTLGKEGLIYSNGKRIIKMPAINCDVLDTTGAGDTLAGNLAAFLIKGLDLQHALRKAMYASTMKLSKKSAQSGMPYYEDLENFIMTIRNKKFEYNVELNFANQLVKDAYEQIKYTNKFAIYSKSDASLVTDTDLAIEKYLLQEISKKFPNDNFVTEENYPNNKMNSRTWIIDPIDGTSHFIKKDGFWGIQLAFYDQEETQFAVIYLPEKAELYYAAKNQGAYINNNKILPSTPVPSSQAIVEFGGSISKELDTKKTYLQNLLNDDQLSVANILHINASCISYTNLVSGKTDALITSTKTLWDIMPGEFLCKECGIPLIYLDFNETVKLLTTNEELKNLILDSNKDKDETSFNKKLTKK